MICEQCNKKFVPSRSWGPTIRFCSLECAALFRWRNNNKLDSKLKWSVAGKVAYAIRTGKLKRGPCEVCGASTVEAHHDDYDLPLKVRWLCRKHHLQHHDNKNNEQVCAKPVSNT